MCIFKYNFLYFSMLFSNIVKHLTSILLIFFRTFPFFQEKTELFRVHSKKLRYTSSFFCQYISDMEKRSYDPEIYQNRTGIQNCSDQRCRHDRRIQTDLLCSQRQNATDRLCHNNNSNHRNSDRHCQHHILIVHNIDAKPIDHRQNQTDYKCNPHLFEDHPENVLELNFTYCNSPNYQCRTLGSAVSSCSHQHRDKCDQNRHYCHRTLISPQYLSCHSR